MSGYYDLMLLVDPTAPEERRNAAISEAESMINSGGELVGSYDWGTRRMAYEIDHRPEADYRLYQFNGDNALLGPAEPAAAHPRRSASLPHHQAEAGSADPAAARPAGAAPARGARGAGHQGRRPRGRRRAARDEGGQAAPARTGRRRPSQTAAPADQAASRPSRPSQAEPVAAPSTDEE